VTTSCLRLLRPTKRRCLTRIGCYLNSYSNNRQNGRTREPERLPNSTAAEPPPDCRIPVTSQRSLRGLITYGTEGERKSWTSFSKLYGQTLFLRSTYSEEAIPIKSAMQSPSLTPGITTHIRLRDRGKIRKHPSGLTTYDRPRTRGWGISNSSQLSIKRCMEMMIGLSIERQKPCRNTSKYQTN